MARSLSFVFMGAGLVPVAADVDVPVMKLESWNASLPRGIYRGAETRPSGALADLTYFWMADCESCKSGLRELERLRTDPSLVGVLAVRTVVVETDLTAFFGDDARTAGWNADVLVDSKGGFAERLGVLGAPGVVLSDVDGKVVARFNGEPDFDSPGFELLVSTLKNIVKQASAQKKNEPILLASKVRAEVNITSGAGVRFLGAPLSGWFFLFALVCICYAVTKSVMRRRKKPDEPRKSS